ncbi:MAG: LacI family transcriptional regulator [Propionibacteriaceae bacterium]|jgi:DNA-binding LacI/PurR family transcriptional regulator|nr:LacI family transcriptional regulator [Propionibacteriaceae bacterium]
MGTIIDDVAKAAGVSTATVSRALRGLPNVTASTKELVLRAAAELGYVPSRSASALASGHTRSVGLVVPAISRWFFATALEGAEHTLRSAGFDALLYSLPDDTSPRAAFDPDVLRSRVDAVLVVSMFFTADEVELLRSLQLPVVFVSVAQPGFSHVGIDDQEAAIQAVSHLIQLGHKVIGQISGAASDPNPHSPTARRRSGWRLALERAGLEAADELDEPGNMSADGGLLATHALLDRRPDITALFASSDETGMGAIQALRERGLAVGKDVSVVGIDGHNLGGVVGLTTVTQPAYDQGAKAASMLLEALAQPSPELVSVIFGTTLLQRSSAGPAPG